MSTQLAATPVNTIRIYPHDYGTSQQQRQLLDWLEAHPGTDEIWLSTLSGNDSMENHRALVATTAPLADALRAMGKIVSIQLSSCVGHFSGDLYENGFPCRTEDLMVDENGVPTPGVCCLASESFRQWTGEVLALYCRELQIHTAYLDDDVRLQNHAPLNEGCFCPRCLAAFAAFCGREWSREELVAALNSSEDHSVRTQWIDFNIRQLAGFTGAVGRIVHEASPETIMGIQTHHCALFYNGWTYNEMYQAMADSCGKPARVRIGGGIWNDFDPPQMLLRSLHVGCDAADAKACGCVDLITIETEEYPCNASSKSIYGMVLESSMGLAYGVTSVTFQSGSLWAHGGAACCERLFKGVSDARPYQQTLAEISRSTQVACLNLALDKNYINTPVYEGTPPGYHWYNLHLTDASKLMVTGVPVMMDRNRLGAAGTPSVLNAELARGITEENLRACFRNGLIVTGNAFLELQRRNLTGFTGVTAKAVAADKAELLEHEFTAGYTGRRWMWISWEEKAVGFKFADDCRAKAIAALHTAEDFSVGAWSLESEDGRMVVLGCPGDFCRQYNDAQLEMLRNAADWIGGAPLAARLSGCEPLVAVPAADCATGKTRAVTILNAGIAPQNEVTLRLRNPVNAPIYWMQPGDKAPVRIADAPGNQQEITLTLPSLQAWQMGTVFCG